MDGGVLKVCSMECTVSPSELKSKLSPSSWILQLRIAWTGEAAAASSSASALARFVGVYFMVRSGLDKKVEVFVQDLVIQDLSLRKKEEENKVGGRRPVLKRKQ